MSCGFHRRTSFLPTNYNGDGGSRTHAPETDLPHFECGPFDLLGTSPCCPETSCKNCFQTQHLYSIVIFSILQVLNMTSSQYLHRMLYRLLIRIFFHFYLPCIFSVALRFFPFYGTGQDKGHFSTSRSCQLIQYGGGQDDG